MDVAIEKIGKNVENSVFSILKRMEYKPKKDKIMIKPNLVGGFPPGSPYITDFRVVGGVIDYLKYLGFEDICICEGAVNTNMNHVFKISGYKKLAREKGVKLVDVYKCRMKRFRYKFGVLDLPELILDSEYINIAKLKTHVHTGVTFCIKNQKGLLPLNQKRVFHKNLHESIADLYKVVRPDFSIIDGLNGVEGNGPGQTGDTVKNINLLILGYDALKVDILATKLIGFNPEGIKHLMLAKGQKGITFSNQALELLRKYQLDFKKPSAYSKFLNNYLWSDERACSGCAGVLGQAKYLIVRNPKYLLKLFHIFKRRDIITGRSKPPADHGKIICLGDCTKSLSKKVEGRFVKGCPPKVRDFLEAL